MPLGTRAQTLIRDSQPWCTVPLTAPAAHPLSATFTLPWQHSRPLPPGSLLRLPPFPVTPHAELSFHTLRLLVLERNYFLRKHLGSSAHIGLVVPHTPRGMDAC